MKPSLSKELSEIKDLTTFHYKVILYLDGNGEATQIEMSERLDTYKSRINVVCKELESMDIIKISRKVGKTIFWKLNPKPTLQHKGQLKFEM